MAGAHPMTVSDDKLALIQAAQLRLLLAGLPASIVSGTTLAALLAYAEQGVIDTGVIIGWFCLVAAVGVARSGLIVWHRRAAPAVIDSKLWLQRFRLGLAISAAAWGLAGWLLFPAGETVHQTLLAFVLAGLSAGAAAAYAVDIVCVIVSLLPALLPFELRLFVEGGEFSTVMGTAVALFIGFMLAIMHEVYRRMRENIVLRIEAVEQERALQIREAHFRLLFEGHSSAMLLIDPATGAIVNANAAASRFYGYTIEQLCGMNIAQINMDKPQDIAATRHQALHGEHNRILFSHRLANDEARTVEVYSSPLVVDGRVHLFQIVHDVTDRKLAEASLHLHDAALNASANAIVITDRDARIEWTNQAFASLTGYRIEEALGRTPGELVKSGLQSELFYQHLWQTILSGRPWHGELVNRRKDGSNYHEEMTITPVCGDNEEISHFVAVKQDISQRKQTEQQIHNLAFYDSLTQLPNRRLLLERLGQALTSGRRSGAHGALMFLDLDNFKALNDTHGHPVGDLLLIEAACRLSRCVRAGDTVARLGGDEFVVMLENLSIDKAQASANAGEVAEKIQVSLSEPYLLQRRQSGDRDDTVKHHCTSSIGIVLFNHEMSKEDILRWADAAMYEAKAAGRNRFRFHHSEISSARGRLSSQATGTGTRIELAGEAARSKEKTEAVETADQARFLAD